VIPAQPSQPLSTLSPSWIGLGLGGAGSFFGPAAQIARGPEPQGLHYTVIPLPAMPPGDVTMQRRAEAFAATFAGRMEDAVDFYRLTVEQNGWMDGILKTMGYGILASPLTFKGDPEIVSALLDADGTPGDWFKMHPDAEVGKIVSDMIGMNFGLGQYVLMCWNCGGVEWWVDRAPNPAYQTGEDDKPIGPTIDVQRCKKCKRAASERPVGQRVLYQLCWRDARWLWRNTVTGQWRYTGRQGQVDVNPGDGEWVLLQAGPDTDIWRHGPWTWGTVAATFSYDSTCDRQLTSAVCAPTHVFKAQGGTGQNTRADVEAQAQQLKWGNMLMLPGEWEHRIDAAKAEFVDVTAAIVEWAYTQWAVGVTGNAAAIKPATGFANLDFYAVTERTRRAFLAAAVIRQLCAQGGRWYVEDNWGAGRVMPVGYYDTRSPEDKLAESKALEQEGTALKSLHDGLDAVGYEIDPAWLEERAQTKGVRIRPQARKAPRLLVWDPKTQAAFVTLEQAIADQGLPPLPPGDPRATMMVSTVLQPGGDLDREEPAEPAARIERDDELDDQDDDEDEAGRLAVENTDAGLDRCPYHGRTHSCPRCGVRRAYGLDPVTKQPRIAWRPLKKARVRAAAA
jgi:hypothetical protein